MKADISSVVLTVLVIVGYFLDWFSLPLAIALMLAKWKFIIDFK